MQCWKPLKLIPLNTVRTSRFPVSHLHYSQSAIFIFKYPDILIFFLSPYQYVGCFPHHSVCPFFSFYQELSFRIQMYLSSIHLIYWGLFSTPQYLPEFSSSTKVLFVFHCSCSSSFPQAFQQPRTPQRKTSCSFSYKISYTIMYYTIDRFFCFFQFFRV